MTRCGAAVCICLALLCAGCGTRGATAGAQASKHRAPPVVPAQPTTPPPQPASAGAAPPPASTPPRARIIRDASGATPVAPFAVVVGNDPGARPQSGIARADIVWEILAEGWITRYLAIFDHLGAGQIGPVRSARIYFDQLAAAYGLPFAHAGGNVDALDALSALPIVNLDEIYTAGDAFWRGGSRRAPDNLYTSSNRINAALRARRRTGGRLHFPPVTAEPQGGVATGGISIDYMRSRVYSYSVGWRWYGGTWGRSVDGAPSADLDGTAVRAGTVVVLVVRQAPDPDPHTPGAIKMLWRQGGQAWVLRDGRRFAAHWRFGGPDAVRLVGTGGARLGIAPQLPVWYEVVPTRQDVHFSS